MNKSYLPYAVAGAAGAIVASALPLLLTTSHAETKLLPFQGRLTDAAGNAIADGAKVVEFKMYNAPTGGDVKWAGEVHKLSVNGGLVNTMLGSKSSLSAVDFATPVYLQITVDANGDGQINASDPPLLPRQSVVPAVYAVESGNSRKLNNADWSAILTGGTEDPETGTLRGDKLAGGSVNTAQLANGAVKAAQLDANAVSSGQIVDGTIQVGDLSLGLQQGIIPPGTVVAFAGKSEQAPPGWTFCDGRSLLKTDPQFASLFAAIGTIHGTNDSTQFSLPDYRGRFLRGSADSDGAGGQNPANRDPDAGTRVSLEAGRDSSLTGSVQDDAFQSHTHSMGPYNSWALANNSGALQQPRVTLWDRAPSAGIYGNFELGFTGTSSETRPKNAYVNYIIKL